MTNEKGIEVIAEVDFKDGKKSVTYLLGMDNQLYNTNGMNHGLSPFSEKAKYLMFNLPHSLEYVLEHSTLNLKDKTTIDGAEYYRTVIKKD